MSLEKLPEFLWDKDRSSQTKTKLCPLISAIPTMRVCKNISSDTIYKTAIDTNSTLISWDMLVSNDVAAYLNNLTKRFANKKNVEVVWAENLQQAYELSKNGEWVMFLAPHQSHTIEAPIYMSAIFETNPEFANSVTNILRMWLFDGSGLKRYFQNTMLMACRSIVTCSEKEKFLYWEKWERIWNVASRTILKSLKSKTPLFLYPEWTRWARQDLWMIPLSDGSIWLLDFALKLDYYVVPCYTDWLWVKSDSVKVSFWKPIKITDLYEDKPMPEDFKEVVYKSLLLQTIWDLKKELKVRKINLSEKLLNFIEMFEDLLLSWRRIQEIHGFFFHDSLLDTLPNWFKEWIFSLKEFSPKTEHLQKLWKYGRFMAVNMPENMRWIFR